MTVPELAKMLRVSKPTAYSAVKRGEVPGVVKIGGCLRISRAAVLRWIGEQAASDTASGVTDEC